MSNLEEAIAILQNDHDNGASVLATQSLTLLTSLITNTENPYIAQQLWETICSCGWELKNARPSMDAAIGGALISALYNVKRRWDRDFGESWASGGCRGSLMNSAAVAAVEETIEKRKETLLLLNHAFIAWIKDKTEKQGSRPIKILTLSYSSTLKACLSAALRSIPGLQVDLRLLESRPRFEGSYLALALLKDFKNEVDIQRLHVQVESDASVAMLAKNVDIVLLGADRISRSGCVSNKTGSLAATLCAKALSPTAQVVVVSESDKIVVDVDLEQHAEEENDNSEIRDAWGEKWKTMEEELGFNGSHGVTTRNVYFETVEGRYIDKYICESGVLSKEDISRMSLGREQKEVAIFGPFQEDV